MASLLSAAVSPIQRAMSASSRQMAKLPNVCVIGKYPDPNLGLPFRNGHASAGARLNQGSTMKITYLLTALLLVSSFVTQATTVRTNKSGNRAHVGTRPAVG